jgi:O-antigen ligase
MIGALGISLLCTLDPLIRFFVITADGLLRWNTFNYFLLAVMTAFLTFLLRVSDPHSRVLKIFIALLLADLVFSPDIVNGAQHILGILSTFGLLAYFAQAADDSDLWYMVAVVNGLAGAVGGLAYYLLKDTVPYLNANVWSLSPEAALFCICLGFRSAQGRKHGQLILGLLATANTSWVFLSGSRGGLLIASIGMAFILTTMRRTTERVAYVAVAVVVAVTAVNVFSAQSERSAGRLSKMLNENLDASARTNGRSELAKAGLLMFERHPLGVGTGGFAPTWAGWGFVPGISSFMRGQEFQAHAGWVKVLAENGWPGILLLLAYVGSFAFCGMKLGRPGTGALGLFVTATLTVTFLSTEFQGKGFWLLTAAATAQLHPAEMARCLRVEARRFSVRPRRVLEHASA